MGTLKVIVLILDLVCAVALTVAILFQSSKSNGMGAIAGSSDSFMSKGGSKTLDAKLSTLTKYLGTAFVILSLFAVILVSATKNQPASTPETEATVVTTEFAAATTEAAAATTEAAVETTTPVTTEAAAATTEAAAVTTEAAVETTAPVTTAD